MFGTGFFICLIAISGGNPICGGLPHQISKLMRFRDICGFRLRNSWSQLETTIFDVEYNNNCQKRLLDANKNTEINQKCLSTQSRLQMIEPRTNIIHTILLLPIQPMNLSTNLSDPRNEDQSVYIYSVCDWDQESGLNIITLPPFFDYSISHQRMKQDSFDLRNPDLFQTLWK